MTKIKSFTVGLPVTELKRAVEWYRHCLGMKRELSFICRAAGSETCPNKCPSADWPTLFRFAPAR